MQRLNFREYKYLEKFSKWLKLLFWFLQIYRNWFNLIWSYTSKLIKRKQKKEKEKKKKKGWTAPARPAQQWASHRSPSSRTDGANAPSSSSFTYRSVHYISMAVPLPLLFPSILLLIFLRFQYETWWKYSIGSIQGISFPLWSLICPISHGEPNVAGGHSSLDLHAQTL